MPRRSPAWLAVAASLVIARAAPAASDTVEITRDKLQAYDGRSADVDRLTLRVAEAGADGEKPFEHRVSALVLRGPSPATRAPIVFLMGGPGVPASTIARIPPYFTLFQRLQKLADVVLVDQRGTGASAPTLDCPAGAPPDPGFLVGMDDLSRALSTSNAACARSLRDRGIPLEAYSPMAIAVDLERVREALGAERLALLGFSYGTRLALEYARRFPARVDRVALQGPLGPEHVVRLPSVLDALLARVAASVRRDPTGHALVDDLPRRIAALLRSFDAAPRAVTVGDGVTVRVGGDGLRAIIGGHLGDPRLPALVAGLRRDDRRLLTMLVAGLYGDLAKGGGSLFGRAMYCAAPGSAAREKRAAAETRRSPLGAVFDNIPQQAAFCAASGLRFSRRDPEPLPPIGRPGLVIAGTFDDRTPLPNAAEVARAFSPSATVTVENGGHELLPDDDVQDLVARFFAGEPVRSQVLSHPAPRYATMEEALTPRGPHGPR
jgi:pimeloyl-ACP methyl ester carboxylesterase